MTKRRTAGSRSEAKNRDAFSKREERASLERLPVLNEKAYDFLNASPLMPEAMCGALAEKRLCCLCHTDEGSI